MCRKDQIPRKGIETGLTNLTNLRLDSRKDQIPRKGIETLCQLCQAQRRIAGQDRRKDQIPRKGIETLFRP